eukprot:12960036-Ditylum_brightwellii.AAC.1
MESSCLRFHMHWALTGLRVACQGDKLPRGLQKCDPLYVAFTSFFPRVNQSSTIQSILVPLSILVPSILV